MNANKAERISFDADLTFPILSCMPDGKSDFLPDLHRSRIAMEMISLFGETMSTKTSNTSDAKQKRQS